MTELIPDGPVERCLDALFDRLAGTGGAGRRSIAEVEDHLRAATAEGLQRGLTSEAAEQSAVERFGDPAQIASDLRRAHRGLGSLLRPIIVGGWWLGVVGALAIGLSGVLSEIAGRVFGPAFVAGDAAGVTYTPERCAQYEALFSHPMSCGAAATEDHWGEIVVGRVAVGVLGLLALGVWLLFRRRLARPDWRPQGTSVALVATALFGLAAAGLLGLSLLQFASGTRHGVGASLADGAVAGVVAVAAAIIGLRLVGRREGARATTLT